MPATTGYRLDYWNEPPQISREHSLGSEFLDTAYSPRDLDSCVEFVLQSALPEVDAYRWVNPDVARAIAHEIASEIYVEGADVVAALANYLRKADEVQPVAADVPTLYVVGITDTHSGAKEARTVPPFTSPIGA